jgi:hypothetical protein
MREIFLILSFFIIFSQTVLSLEGLGDYGPGRSQPADFAGPCKRVNLLYKKWGLFPRQMPLYDQGANMMCYSYTAVQLVDYWREDHGLKIGKIKMMPSTPLYGAFLSRVLLPKVGGKQTLDLGSISLVLEGIKKYGMCKENIIKKIIKKFTSDKKISQEEFLFETERLFALHSGESFNLGGAIWTPFEKIRNWKYPPKINREKLKWAMGPYLKKENFVKFLKNVFGECFLKENIILDSQKIPTSVRLYMRNRKTFYHAIIKLLDKGNKPQPIGIGYCSNVLSDKSYEGMVFRGNEPIQEKYNCNGHASVIVGKRTRKGRCEFLVRNTWGTDCEYSWECLKNKKGHVQGLWVDGISLVNNSQALYYLAPEGQKVFGKRMTLPK